MKSHTLIVLSFACALASACSSNKPANDPGPAQKAGAAVDEGARDAKESAQEFVVEVAAATEKAGDKLQDPKKDGD